MSNVLIELTGSMWGNSNGDIVRARPHPEIPGGYRVEGTSDWVGALVLTESLPVGVLTFEAWGGRLVESDAEDQKTYTVVTHQSIAKVYVVKADSREEAHEKAMVGDAGNPVSVTYSPVERTVL